MRATSRLVVFLAAAVLAIALAAWVVMSRRPPEVAVLEIRPATIEQALSVVGRVRPLELVQVASPNAGQVVRLLHDEGDRVAAGDPLAVVLAAVERAQTQADVARERAARAAATEARLNYQRVKTLYDRGFAAKAALDEIEAGLVPDVLITDHVMADKNGAQFAQELRQRIPSLPVLIITGYANLTPAQMQGFEVLAKPYRRAELAARLARLLSPDD